jgi:Protein of unknown function DUF262
MSTNSEIMDSRKESADIEIRDKQKQISYDTKEYPVEVIVQKYLHGKEDDTNELFIPDYQREMAWDEPRQSKFIESVLLGLPIPYLFVADIRDDENDLGRLEIIDGSQRIRTLTRFIENELILSGLKKLTQLNDFRFSDLPLSRQRRFNRTTLRMIQLTESADEEVRRDLFERINTGSVDLNEMEKRRGILRGAFLDLVEELSQDSVFRDLCSFDQSAIDRREPQEFVLRFFAFLNNYHNFNARRMNEFLDEYLASVNNDNKFESEQETMIAEFRSMLNFISKYFPGGFRRGSKLDKTTTRIKFESLSVGVTLALRQKENLQIKSTSWIDSDEFKKYTSGDGSSSNVKVTKRIEYVRDRLLSES